MLCYGQDFYIYFFGLSAEPWEDQLVDDNLTSNTGSGTSDMQFSYWIGYESNGKKTNTAEV